MADASVLKEFLIALGFKVDGQQQFQKSVTLSQQSVTNLNNAVTQLGKTLAAIGQQLAGPNTQNATHKFAENADRMRKGVMALGETAITAGTAWAAAITNVASEYERLYYTARRVGGSVADLKQAGMAAERTGIGAGNLQGALEGLTSQVRASPGIRGIVNNWIGADFDKVKDKVNGALIPVLDHLKGMRREIAYQWADQMGISRRMLDDYIVNGDEYKKQAAEMAALMKNAGIDAEKIGEQSKEFWNDLRNIGDRIGLIWTQAFGDAFPIIDKTFKTIIAGLDAVLAWNKDHPGWGFAESVAMAIGSIVALRVAVASLKWVLGIAAAGGGGAAAAAGGGGFLAGLASVLRFGLTRLTPWGAGLALGMTPTEANKGEDEAIRRFKAMSPEEQRRAMTGEPPPLGPGQARDLGGNPVDRPAPNAIAPPPAMGAPRTGPALPGTAGFGERVSAVINDLMSNFHLTEEQAAGLAGNLAFESAGLTPGIQEGRPISGRGGLGYAQWTGPRRRAFEAWSAAHHLDVHSEEANRGFLMHELATSQNQTIQALRRQGNIGAATFSVGQTFERPFGTTASNLPGYRRRLEWAQRAFEAHRHAVRPPAVEAGAAGNGQQVSMNVTNNINVQGAAGEHPSVTANRYAGAHRRVYGDLQRDLQTSMA